MCLGRLSTTVINWVLTGRWIYSKAYYASRHTLPQRRSADLRPLLPPASDLLFCSTLRVLYARSLYSRRRVDHPDWRVSGTVRTQRIAPDHFDGLVRWLV